MFFGKRENRIGKKIGKVVWVRFITRDNPINWSASDCFSLHALCDTGYPESKCKRPRGVKSLKKKSSRSLTKNKCKTEPEFITLKS